MANMMSNGDGCSLYLVIHSEITDFELIEGIERWEIRLGLCTILTNVSRVE